MYEQYLNMPSVPAGFIIKRIMEKSGMTQSQLSEKSGIIKQRLYDYINNKRKISVEVSFLLEDALGLGANGFFYKIQANHDIYTQLKEHKNEHKPNLSQFRNALFWDVNKECIDWERQKEWIILRVFEYGNEKEIHTLIDFYGRESIIETLNNTHSNWKQESRFSNINKYLK